MIWGRIKQGLRALFAFAYPVDLDLVRETLNDAEYELFIQLSRSEQLHSIRVLRDVLAQESDTPSELAQAALLHDIGKVRYRLAIWQKTIAVLVKAFSPQTEAKMIADDTLTFWRAPFVVRHYHPVWGGQLLIETNSHPTTIWLTTHHAEDVEIHKSTPYYDLLRRLQVADDAN